MAIDTDFKFGILGGIVTYLTNFFLEYAEQFQAERKWERPRIIDHNCTMTNHFMAALYGEKIDVLVKSMVKSMSLLLCASVARIVLACNMTF